MIGSTNRPCQECHGKGVVVVAGEKAADGKAGPPVTRPCPACRGKGTTTGIVTK